MLLAMLIKERREAGGSTRTVPVVGDDCTDEIFFGWEEAGLNRMQKDRHHPIISTLLKAR